MLDGLLGLAADLAAVPSTGGPDPAAEGVAGRASPSCDSDVEGEMLRRAEDELAGLNDIAPAAHGAEAADDRVEADLPRDVDWM